MKNKLLFPRLSAKELQGFAVKDLKTRDDMDILFIILMATFPQINMDQVANQAIYPVERFIQDDALDKQDWKSTYQLTDFTVPNVVDAPTIKKKFKVQATFYDQATKKQFVKTIYFGQDGDFIFTKNRNDRLKRLGSMRHKDNPLHSNYWRAQVCFYSQDFIQNCQRMVAYLLQRRLSALNNVPPKRDFTPAIAKRQATLFEKKKKS